MQENSSEVKESVKTYYGETLQSSSDLKTDACCTADALPDFTKPILSKIHDEVHAKYYGCGVIVPEEIQNKRILDLGSGSGRDCYVLSALVGEKGYVVGVDMTDAQLEVANKYIGYMTEQFGFPKPNVEFKKGDIEALELLNLEPQSFDCVVSNCVVNLAEDKKKVLQGAYNLLKNGGEIYFSDVYSDRRIPGELIKDPILYGECLSGALYWNDFLKLAREVGFTDPRKVTSRVLEIPNNAVREKIGNIQFYSTTYRLFKIQGLEEDCEDYGHAVRYKGSATNHKDFFQLDEGHKFETGRIYPVCGNTYLMLNVSRFKEHFDFWGDFSTHYGIFPDCGSEPAVPPSSSPTENTGGSCC